MLHPDLARGGRPRGSHSEHDAVKEEKVSGGVLRPEQPLCIPNDSEIRHAGLRQDEFQDWPAIWSHRREQRLMAPTFVHADPDGNVCEESVFGEHGWRDPVWTRRCTREARRVDGNLTSIVSFWVSGGNYYHWFLDGLTRLVHLSAFPPDCRILVPDGLPAFASESLELLGLSDRLETATTQDIIAEDYWFAGPLMMSGCPDPIGVPWLRRRLARPAERPTRRIFVKRSASTRCIENDEELNSLFSDLGWEVVDPARRSLRDQIRLFGEAEMVVGAHGAALTNILWMGEGGKVLELMPSKRRNGCYAGISLAAGLHHEVLVQPSNREGNMQVSLRPVMEVLKSWGVVES